MPVFETVNLFIVLDLLVFIIAFVVAKVPEDKLRMALFPLGLCMFFVVAVPVLGWAKGDPNYSLGLVIAWEVNALAAALAGCCLGVYRSKKEKQRIKEIWGRKIDFK